ncbi:hypothetical protein [Methylobacterium sp. yr668]|uniref:hypothetical protein n=1 Tax=Methylobacterium sp. yr668 TaxID=1761801 RepID=UPI0008E2EB62|nr:hypothetical protein [Methylobacterium sp. yr668]SFT11868.1 hypothetical protein SAMN04487845_11742 [Methylobacterium sp. yr668]
MSNLALIQPQRVDFDTTQATDWLDGLPMIGTPGLGGMVAGAANIGNGALTVASIAAGTTYGAHVVAVTAVAGGLAYISATDPNGIATGQGVVGVPLYAAGINLLLTPGATAFAVGDSFAIAVVPQPVDLTGLVFDLDARQSVGEATIALQATSGGLSPAIANGGPLGVIAMAVARATMARLPVKAEGYPYGITATDPATGLRVPAFYGLIHHTAVPAQIGQGA